MLFKVTAYCICLICCGKEDGITASGRPAEVGITAACGRDLYGKVIYIEGEGLRFCEDRGSAIREGRIDILFPSHEEAKKFGVRRLEVRVLGDWR